MTRNFFKLCSFTFVCLIFLSVFSQGLSAATFTVTKIADTNDGLCNADCSLREAVVAANALAGTDTIDFDGIVFSGSQTISLTLGQLSLTTTINLVGTGANILTVSGSGVSRVFANSGANTTISGLSITMGNGVGAPNSGFGGGVINSGSLTLNMVAVSGNTSQPSSNGGGIYNLGTGTLTITNSTINNNSGDTGGGGILNFFGGTMTVNNTTISGNNVPTSGGGGGIANVGTFNANSITVASNTAPTSAGGGVVNFGTFNSQNSIYADNTANSNPDFSGTLSSLNYNLVEDITGTTISPLFEPGKRSKNGSESKTGSLAANDITGLDPILLPLGNYGGPTNTQPPNIGGPVIDKGQSGPLTTDQRGLTRPVDQPSISNAPGGNTADIGAVERQAPTAAFVSVGGRVTTISGQGIVRANVSINMPDGGIRTTVSNSFGNFSFSDIEVGQTLVFSVFSKNYVFNVRAENILAERSDIVLMAIE